MSDELHLGDDLAAFTGFGEPLSPDRRAACERHLETCETCRDAVREAEIVMGATMGPALTPSADFDARLSLRLDGLDAESKVAARREWWQRLFGSGRWALALGPVAAAVMWFVMRRPRDVDELNESNGAVAALGALDDLELGENLELYRDLDAIEYLDVADDLELLMNEEEAPG